MAREIIRNRKALSPVIATVILVSVTIVVAVAVAYWMGGIAGLYTRFEKMEITSCYAVKDANGNYNVTVQLRNSGSADSTIDYVLINGKPVSEYQGITVRDSENDTLPLAIPLGQSGTVYIDINKGVFQPGTTLDLKFHSAAGKEYPQMLPLS